MYKIAPCLDVCIQKVFFQKPAAPWEIKNGLSEMYTKSILLAEYLPDAFQAFLSG